MILNSRILRSIFLVSLFFSLSAFVFADTIRLKDGSIIKGKIISFGNGTFTVVIGDEVRPRQMTFRADEIESIKFENETSTVNMVKASETLKTEPPTIKRENDSTVIIVGQGGKSPEQSVKNEPKPNIPEVAENDQPIGSDPINEQISPVTNIKPIELTAKVLADNTSNGWTNSGWVVRKGQKIKIIGTGKVSLGSGRYSSPTGINSLPDNGKLIQDQPTGGLIAVIGDDNNDFIFIGADKEFTATRDGALFLGVNEGNLNDNSGAFDVKIQISPVTD